MGLFRKKKKEEIKQEVKIETNNNTTVPNVNEPSPIVSENTNTQNVKPEETIQITPSNAEQLAEVPLENTDNKPEEVEVIDLEDSKEKIKTKIERKKDLTFLFILFGSVIIFAFAMPVIRNIFIPKPSIRLEGDTTVQDESGNLEHGYLVINKDSYKRVENIKFYEFKKYENNKIVFNYVASKNISNPSKLNIFIEVVDPSGIIVHKEKFDLDTKLKKEASSSYSMDLSSSMYENAYYIKIEVIENGNYTKTLVCNKEEKSSSVKTSTEITYTFTENMLMNYIYNQSYQLLEEESKEDYSQKYKDQYDLLKKTNIKTKDLEYTEDSIYYKIDFSYFKLGDLEFKTRYSLYDYYDAIKKYEKQKGWTCI